MIVTDFHPDCVKAGFRTEFTEAQETFQLPNQDHTRQTYLDAIGGNGFIISHVDDVTIREVPMDYVPEPFRPVIHEYYDVNLCLAILAKKTGS